MQRMGGRRTATSRISVLASAVGMTWGMGKKRYTGGIARRAAKRWLLAGALTAGVTLVGTPAQAEDHPWKTSVAYEDNTLIIKGSQNDDRVHVSYRKRIRVEVWHLKSNIVVGPGCEIYGTDDDPLVLCGPLTVNPAVAVNFDLREGDDTVIFSDMGRDPVAARGLVLGGGGDDTMIVGATAKHPGGGVNHSAVTYRGGEGEDWVRYWYAETGVNVSLGSPGSDDGRKGLDRDDIARDVENVEGTDHDDTLIGSDVGNRLEGKGGSNRLRGNGGDDYIDASHSDSRDEVDCGSGTDIVKHEERDDTVANCEEYR